MVTAAVERRTDTASIRRLKHEEEPTTNNTTTQTEPAATEPATTGRTATDRTRTDTRNRFAADNGAAQIRSRADRALIRGDDNAADPVEGTQGIGPAPHTEGSGRICAVDPVNDADYQKALQNQRDLSKARQDLGAAQLELENRNIVKRGWDKITGGDDAKEKRVAELQKKVTELEAQEAALPEAATEKARFTVFNERIAEIEKTHGKKYAAKIARQTYYNSRAWNEAAGTKEATDGAINAAGLPHGPKKEEGLAVGGYPGHMRTPDGKPVDMGHVAVALDWQVNSDRPRNIYGNPFDENSVTLTGDLATAITGTPAGPDAQNRARRSIADEGEHDWNGDLDGNNLANRLKQNPGASLTDTLNGYYGSGAYERRVDEWATHSKYVKRDSNGTPQRDDQGNYVVDKEALRRDAKNFSVFTSKGQSLRPDKNYAENEVIDAWVEWLNGARAAPGTC